MMTPADQDRLLDLVVEWDALRRQGQTKSAEELCPDDVALQSALRERIEQRLRIEQLIEPSASLIEDSCSRGIPGAGRLTNDEGMSVSPALPEWIGRYRVERLLGFGGFGRVYLAHDDKLKRHVAIKVPHPELVKRPEHIHAYVREARSVASLEHPHIVPVFDVGATEHYPCFVVSKYIPGTNLSVRMNQSRLSFSESARVVASVAEALHYSHTHGLVHRDIKPLNILLSESGEPFVVDFGLSLREQDPTDERRFAGTPAYMSPEQARGEAHRVDGRSDIFSLGVVFYELLVGRKPFQGDSNSEILVQITSVEPKPPRQTNDRIPKELERICLKSLAKRAGDRYTTALDLAEDLHQFLAAPTPIPTTDSTPRTLQVRTAVSAAVAAVREPQHPAGLPTGPNSDSDERPPTMKIVPRGLRSFDEHDADFFLSLLPGPLDREGLPDSIRFWKTRIEERDANKTFTVGILYGPSGCGKSSLVKAGLLPRLSAQIVSIYVEATEKETEAQLLNGIHRRFPAIPDSWNLTATLIGLRQHLDTSGGGKVVLVLDQFEQWLHSRQTRSHSSSSELADALRQCDGEHLQTLIMVRDDFWMATTRFAREIEVPLVDGLSINAVDLFPLRHATKVLIEFGRALGCIAAQSTQITTPQQAMITTPQQAMITTPQQAFVDQALIELAEDGLVVPVRLVIFAEMLKEKPWVPATLKQVGGIQGVGVTFLETMFSRSTSNVSRRSHGKAAQAVLKALLPETGTDIRGQQRTYAELLEVSGYRNRVADFDDLLRILGRELRLIIQSEMHRSTENSSPDPQTRNDQFRFQLTHDYLVPSLRNWLTQKQKETLRGRAELLMADRAALWNSRPDKRFLPSAAEFVSIRLFTKSSQWTNPQRRMMASAGRRHLVRWGGIVAVLLVIGFAIRWQASDRMEERVKVAVDNVFDCKATLVAEALRKLESFPNEIVARICRSREIASRTTELGKEQQLRKMYILSQVGDADAESLLDQISAARSSEVSNLIATLGRSRARTLELLRQYLQDEEVERDFELQSKIAIVALYLADATLASEACQIEDRPNPAMRNSFIEELYQWHGDPLELVRLMRLSKDVGLRSAICLCLQGMASNASNAAKSAWNPILTKWWQTAPDCVTQSSAERILLVWRMDASIQDSMRRMDDSRDWYFNSLEMKMTRIPPRHAGHVSPMESSSDRRSEFLICDREVNFAQFNLFLEDPDYPEADKPEEPDNTIRNKQAWLLPVYQVNWYTAVKFCNWLSVKERMIPCYERTGQKGLDGQDEWRLNDDANGYRLPTCAQWEFACRAGTIGPYSFGFDPYERRFANLSAFLRRGASTFPNGWGLFDMHGSVAEWCHESWERIHEQDRVSAVRGGNATMDVHTSRSDAKWEYISSWSFPRIGFRVARVPSTTEKLTGMTD